MTSWIWISEPLLDRIHQLQITEFGGLVGVRDENAVASALARPQQRANYGEPDIAELGASYLYGLAKNHGFNDGNKRTAWVATKVFCKINGYDLKELEPDVVSMVNSVAGGELSEERLTLWLRERLTKQKSQPRG
jgi:death on curing protein